MPITRKPLALPAQLLDLTLIQLSNWRWSWRSMIIVGAAAPMLSIAALGFFARDSGTYTLGYILTGNLTLALMFENIGKVSSNFAFMRQVGTLNYFASLPIHRYALIVATVLAFLLLSLPAALVTLIFGAWYLHIPLAIHPLIVLAVPMIAIPLAGVGALIGSLSPTPEAAGSMNLLVTMLLVGLGPVVVPPEELPALMLWLGKLSPATYAASALRQVILGPLSGQLALDFAALAATSLIVFWLVEKKMDWRQG